MSARFSTLALSATAFALLGASPGSGCGQDRKPTSNDCVELDGRATECGVLEQGSLCRSIPTDIEQCVAECQLAADCEYLGELLCLDGLPPLPDPEQEIDERGRIALCIDECQFRCDDDIMLEAEFRCDAIVDCVDGTDEQGCDDSTFACANGEMIPLIWVCDGQADCCLDDPSCLGEDELDCADEPTILMCEGP